MAQAIVLTIAMMLAVQTPAVLRAPKDFALRLEFGCGDPHVINTMAGTYSMQTARGWQAARVYVSSKLKDQLFQLVTEERFFSLERAIGLGICEPSTVYRLTVTSNGKTHSLTWSDCHLEPHDDASRHARRLSDGVVKHFHDMGAVKQLLKMPQSLCL